MRYIGLAFIQEEVNRLLITIGWKPNDKLGLVSYLLILFLCLSLFLISKNPWQRDREVYQSIQTVQLWSHEQNFIELDTAGVLIPNALLANKLGTQPEPRNSIALVHSIPVLINDSRGSSSVFEAKDGDVYVFDVMSNRVHEIESAGRNFVVTLKSVEDISVGDRANYRYRFGILEN